MAAVNSTTKDPWYTSLMALPTAGYADGVMDKDIKSLQTKLAAASSTADQVSIWQDWIKSSSNPGFYASVKGVTPTLQKTYADKAKTVYSDAFNQWMVDGKLPTNVQAALTKNPLAPLPELALAQLNYDKGNRASVTAYANALKSAYKDVKNADGTPAFTPEYLDSVAKGTIPQATFDTKLKDLATTAATKDLKAQGISIDDVGGIAGLIKSGGLADYLNDPNKLSSSLGSSSVANAITLKDKAAKAEKDTAALENYDPNAGTWDPSKNTVDTPFGNMLSGLVSGYKNPYAADYVNPLAAVEKPTLTNIKTPFKNNAISQDLVNLFNSAGTDYAGGNNPLTKGTSLGSKMLKLYQPSTTDSSEQLAKPGAPDTTSTTLPKITGDGTTVVNSNGSTTIGGGKDTVSSGAGIDTIKTPITDVVPPKTEIVVPPKTDVVVPPKTEIVAPPVVTPKTEIVAPPVVTPKTEVKRTPWEEEGITEEQYNSWQAENARIESERQAGIQALADKAAAEQKATQDARILAEQKVAAERAALASQANLEASAQNVGYQGDLSDTAAMQGYLNSQNVGVQDYTGNYAKQKAINDARILAEQKAINDARIAAEKAAAAKTVALNPSNGGPTSAIVNPTPAQRDLGPQQVTLAPNTVALSNSPSVIATHQSAANQATVAPPPSGPQPINPSNGGPSSATVGPITAAQRDLGPLNISNLGAVIGPQAMNSNAGGVASLVGPQVTVQPQPAVSQQPAVNYTSAFSSQQQLEDQAVNAGYQGDYSDTAAMQGYLNSLPR